MAPYSGIGTWGSVYRFHNPSCGPRARYFTGEHGRTRTRIRYLWISLLCVWCDTTEIMHSSEARFMASCVSSTICACWAWLGLDTCYGVLVQSWSIHGQQMHVDQRSANSSQSQQAFWAQAAAVNWPSSVWSMQRAGMAALGRRQNRNITSHAQSIQSISITIEPFCYFNVDSPFQHTYMELCVYTHCINGWPGKGQPGQAPRNIPQSG